MPGNRPPLSYDEMRHIVAYLGALQYFEEYGNIDRGQEVFQRKRCAACHGDPDSGAPDLKDKAGRISSYEMVAAVWKHGPAMMEAMLRRKIAWPELAAAEMGDLVAFLHGPRLKRR
jgi:mono/diheme cytochrome c family protein